MSRKIRNRGIAYGVFSLGTSFLLIPGVTFLGSISSILAFVFLFLILFGLASEYEDARLRSLAIQYAFLVIVYAVFIAVFAALLGPDIKPLISSGESVESSQIANLLLRGVGKHTVLYLLFVAALIYGGYILFKYWSIVADKTGISRFKTAGVFCLISPILAATVVLTGLAPAFRLLASIFLLLAFLEVNPMEETQNS